MDNFIVAGTGSRSLVLDESKFTDIYDKLIVLLTDYREIMGNQLTVLSGMAEGFDECLAHASILVGASLMVAIPNKGYGNYYWKRNSLLGEDRMTEFNSLVSYAQDTGGVKYVCPSIYDKGRHSNFIRNEFMADLADVVLVYNPTSSGTRHCYDYCVKTGVATLIVE